MACLFPALAPANPTNYTYTYNEWDVPMPSPDAYRVTAYILGEQLGIGHFNRPQDLQVWENYLYVMDTYNNRIVVLRFDDDGTFELVEVVTHVTMPDGEISSFNRPYGIYISPWELNYGHIWVADTQNQRILHIDRDWNVVNIIDRSKLERSLLEEQLEFLPRKLVVDFSGRILLQAYHINRGLMEFDNEGFFVGYMGAPRVGISPIEQFWRAIATMEQRERRELFVPVEYNNVSIDREGFIYVTTTPDVSPDVHPIRRLNAMGNDILIRNGFTAPIGDLYTGSGAGIFGASHFGDVTALPNESYVVLDVKRGRLFSYNSQGELLYVWGGYGNREGRFLQPTAIESMDFSIFVLTASSSSITRFDLTEYGMNINTALDLYQRGLYDQSVAHWQEVLRMNGNFGPAYIGIARNYLRQGNYTEAMRLFRLQNDARGYGRAFGFYRRIWVEDNFWIFITIIGILIVVPPVVRKVIRLKREIFGT